MKRWIAHFCFLWKNKILKPKTLDSFLAKEEEEEEVQRDVQKDCKGYIKYIKMQVKVLLL